MKKEEFNKIIDEVYKHYQETHQYEPFILQDEMDLSKEDFIKKTTNNYGFGQLFGISLNERELSLEERVKIWDEKYLKDVLPEDSMDNLDLDGDNIPRKLITIIYNDKTIESYE